MVTDMLLCLTRPTPFCYLCFEASKYANEKIVLVIGDMKSRIRDMPIEIKGFA